MKMQVTAVFRVAQYLLRFGEHRLRDGWSGLNLSLFCKEIAFRPIFPRLERLAIYFSRKLNAETFH